MTCPFCDPVPGDVVLENATCYARWDGYPVTPGHLLVVPKRHVATYFEATDEEVRDLWRLVAEAKQRLDAMYAPDGYNLGVNVGEAAGQSVYHLHVHVIPRRRGDHPHPRGGVRHVIPHKGHY